VLPADGDASLPDRYFVLIPPVQPGTRRSPAPPAPRRARSPMSGLGFVPSAAGDCRRCNNADILL